MTGCSYSSVGNIIIAIFSVSALLTILYYTAIAYHDKQFQKNMKKGDRCSVFINQDRYTAWILEVKGNDITVKTESGVILRRCRREVYL